jgi:hypothetical protein
LRAEDLAAIVEAARHAGYEPGLLAEVARSNDRIRAGNRSEAGDSAGTYEVTVDR